MQILIALVVMAGAMQAHDPTAACTTCHDPAALQWSQHGIHAAMGCVSCHAQAAAGYPHRKNMTRPDCAACHADAVAELKKSVHGLAGSANGGPSCGACHGNVHAIVARTHAGSPIAKKNLPSTCGACHSDPQFLESHKVAFARPVEAFRESVHGRALVAGNDAAASCSDCHGSHDIARGRDPASKINHWNVPATCGACHANIKDIYAGSVHGQAVARGVPGAPVCTDCHGEHTILAPREPQSLVNPARVSQVTCSRCHADERLAARYNLPLDKVPAFEDSYHGLAGRAGSQTVANCASCHGVHNILSSSDRRSTVHPVNLATTCGACHAGAGARFAIGPVHVRAQSARAHPVVRWIRWFYLVVIPLTVGFMLLHGALDFVSKLIRGHRPAPGGDELIRMNLHFRIAHWLVVASFPALVYSGFALKFPESWWAAPLLAWEDRVAFRGTLHRAAAVLMLLGVAYHAVHLAVSRRDRSILRALLPRRADATHLWRAIRYNVGTSTDPPQFGKFSYAEKIEYWAFLWGTLVMTASGFLLWFNNFTLRHFPSWVADAATAIHYYEAILAGLSILVWHFYLVIFDPNVYPMERSWLTGRISAEHLKRMRPAYYTELVREQPPPAATAPEAGEQPAQMPRG